MKKLIIIFLFLVSCTITSVTPHIGPHNINFQMTIIFQMVINLH
jgi:hypothetical protein